MTTSELQNRINQAAKKTEQKYQNAVEELGELKKKINDLERVIVDDADATGEDKEKLDSAIDQLIKLTDFMISESERAWEEYRTLERDCRIGAPEPSNVNAQMKALWGLCKKTDELATDLLCYSLAHFKHKDTVTKPLAI